MMDEIDQTRDARDCKNYTKCNRQMWYEAEILRAPNRAQHQQTIEEGSDKCAEHDLIAAVAHEVAQDPWPELRGGKLEREHSDGKDDACHRDHRPRNAGQNRPPTPRSEGVEQAEIPNPLDTEPASTWT